MLLLAIYPIRKRHPSWRVIGSIPLWFNLHKILGIAGPVIILFHSNFGLGARNSNVALFATLIVMTSGIIGRYIYSRINSSIYDGKSALRGLLTDVDAFRDHLGDGVGASDLLAEIRAFGQMAVDRPPQTMIGSLVFGGLLDARSRVLRRRIVAAAQSELAARATEAGWSWFEQMRRSARVDAVVSSYFRRLRNVARHHFFERLFSLWHVMHLPLYFLMIVTALVHVWAVHRY
jgi:hypothetical protein